MPRHEAGRAARTRLISDIIQRINRPSHIFERQLVVVRGANPCAGAFDDVLRHILKASAEVDPGLQHQEFLARRVAA